MNVYIPPTLDATSSIDTRMGEHIGMMHRIRRRRLMGRTVLCGQVPRICRNLAISVCARRAKISNVHRPPSTVGDTQLCRAN